MEVLLDPHRHAIAHGNSLAVVADSLGARQGYVGCLSPQRRHVCTYASIRPSRILHRHLVCGSLRELQVKDHKAMTYLHEYCRDGA